MTGRQVHAALRAGFRLAGILIVPAVAMAADPPPVRVLDDFNDIAVWHVSTSDDVRATLHAATGRDGRALCVDFDFGAVSGYVSVGRELAMEYPQNFEFTFGLRGDAPPGDLQFKLVDASGENVWWVNRPAFTVPHKWQPVRFKKRHVSFAWGPLQDRNLVRSARLEFVIARGREGGKGSVCFDRLTFRELPADSSAAPTTAKVSASSKLRPTRPNQAFDRIAATAWRSDPDTGPEQTLTLDLLEPDRKSVV